MSRTSLNLLIPIESRPASQSSSRPASPGLPIDIYDCESLSSDESTRTNWRRSSYTAPPSSSHYHSNVFAHATTSSSNIASVYHTPVQSRSSSPLPYPNQYFNSEDDQPYESLLGRTTTGRYIASPSPRRKWWTDGSGRRVVRRRLSRSRAWSRFLSSVVRHPLFPAQPSTLLLTVTVILIFGLSITLLLMYILNPDKAPLPWRSYCALSPAFPVATLNKIPPVGIFLGVMSTDTAVERRMLIRSTWAKHARSRGTDGSTDRTIVRFVMGLPQGDWVRRIQLEAETYKDMILLPVPENMNNGKTHAYIDWAHVNAFVPPPSARSLNLTSNETSEVPIIYPSPYYSSSSNSSRYIFPSFKSDRQSPPPALAPHDPPLADKDVKWVRPQFVIKADDDAFVMLSELEARLRLEWHDALLDATRATDLTRSLTSQTARSPGITTVSPLRLPQRMTKMVAGKAPSTSTVTEFENADAPPAGLSDIDPMIYWGYLVKARFMAGELYALSSSLVDYIATNPSVQTMVRGAEDKQTAKWLRMHPRASEVRWRSERCWIYDHPRAGTVYSHGFLFPSEVAHIRHETTHGLTPAEIHLLPTSTSTSDPSLTHSTVSRFGVRYIPPSTNLTTDQEVEALIEGSALSRLRDESVGGRIGKATDLEVQAAWARRQSRFQRSGPGSVGGTIVVHFIKRNEWFLETALAFLDKDLGGSAVTPEYPEMPALIPSEAGDTPEHLRIETDLSNKAPIDLSNLDSQPNGPTRIETDLSNKTPIDLSNLDDLHALPPSTPDISRISTDFRNKSPLDLSNLDPLPDAVEVVLRPLESSSPSILSVDEIVIIVNGESAASDTVDDLKSPDAGSEVDLDNPPPQPESVDS